MQTTTAIAAATLISAGLLGAAFVSSSRGPGSGAGDPAAVQALGARVDGLEASVDRLTGERDRARHDAQQALAVALGHEARLAELERDNEELLAIVTGTSAPPVARAGGPAAPARRAAAGADAGAETAAVESALASAMPIGGGVVEPTPEQRAIVQKALADIRAQEQEEERVEREQRQRQRMDERLARLSEQLQLQPFQREELGRIYAESWEQRRAMMNAFRDGGLPPEEGRAQMEAFREAEKQKVQAVLTPDQYAGLTKIEEEERQQRESFGRGGRGGGGPPGP